MTQVRGGVTTFTDWEYDANGDGDTSDNGDATFGYDHEGTRVKRVVIGGDTIEYLQDKNNPTGYSQILEEKKNSSLDRSYVLGHAVLGQSVGTNIKWLVSDGHGSTRLLIQPNGTVAESYAYDDYGNAIGFTPGTAQTSVLYTNQVFDPIVQQYVLRARYYNQAIGSFSSFDSYEGSIHKYLYANSNPIYFFDPSGMDSDVISLTRNIGIGQVLLTIGAIGSGLVLSKMLSQVQTVNAVNDMLDSLVASGSAAASAAYGQLIGRTKEVANAIKKATAAAQRAGNAINQISKMPIFPIIRSMGPNIFAFDVAALTANPTWFVLTYNGPLSGVTTANRAWVMGRWGYLMAGAPAGSWLDEFPYASTAQGGRAGPALASPVPALENMVQGGLLSTFYRVSLKNTGGRSFLVVPIPI